MPKVNLEILSTGEIICKDKSCVFKLECANHESADDFRSEDGFTPELYLGLDKNICRTKSKPVIYGVQRLPENYNSLDNGMLVINNNKLEVFGGY